MGKTSKGAVALALALSLPAGAYGQTEPNTIGRAEDFRVRTVTYGNNSGEVIDGCMTPGTWRVLEFASINENWGNADLVIGTVPPDGQSTADFVWDEAHGHHHHPGFFGLDLFKEDTTKQGSGSKFGFCLMSNYGPVYTPAPVQQIQFGCPPGDIQGISAGFGDKYDNDTTCNLINLTGVPDGSYLMASTSNASRSKAEADPFDNTTAHRINITGSNVTQPAPFFRSSVEVVPAVGGGTTEIAVAARQPSSYDAFWKGAGGHVFTNWKIQQSSWQAPNGGEIFNASQPYSLKEAPTAYASAPQALDVFGRNTNNEILRFQWRGGAWTYSSMGGSAGGPPGAAAGEENRKIVGVIWTDGTFRFRRYNGTSWTAWAAFGNGFDPTYRPVIVASGRDTFHVFVRVPGGNVSWARLHNGVWSSQWSTLGGPFAGPIAAASHNVNKVDVFARGTDNKLYHRVYDSGWSANWVAESVAEMASAPAVIAPRPNRLEVFYYYMSSGTVFYKRRAWDGTNWTVETPTAANNISTAVPPVLATWGSNVVSIFHAIQGGAVRQRERR
jgi:hypothetical protein